MQTGGCPSPFGPTRILVHSFDVGMIAWWYGNIASIPDGYALCDGSNGTPDLRDRFVIPALQDDEGVAKATIRGTLQQKVNYPNHGHSLLFDTAIIHSAPAGSISSGVVFQYHYPPCKVLCLIMQL